MNRPRAEWWDEAPETAREIHYEEQSAWTGLYGAQGEPLYREREPFGFQPDRWAMAKKSKKGGKRC